MDSLSSLRTRSDDREKLAYIFRWFCCLQGISLLGTWSQALVVGALLFQTTGSSFLLGINALCLSVPTIILSKPSGRLADTFPPSRIFAFCQLAGLTEAFSLFIFKLTEHLSHTIILLLSLALGISNAIEIPARQKTLTFFSLNKEDLPRIIARNSLLTNIARALGPGLGGLLMTLYGSSVALLLNALSFSGILLFSFSRFFPTQPVYSALTEIIPSCNSTFISRIPIVLMTSVSLTIGPIIGLMPAIADYFSPGKISFIGILGTAAALGGVFGSLLFQVSRIRGLLMRHFLYLPFFPGASLMYLGLVHKTFHSLLAIFFVGVFLASCMVCFNAVCQTSAMDLNRGETMAHFYAAAAVAPLGVLLSGWIAEKIGIRDLLLINGISCILFAACMRLYMCIRGYYD